MDATQLFLQGVKDSKEFDIAVKIIDRNSYGRKWLIGGFVYRTLALQLYGTPISKSDMDFIVELPSPEVCLPPGWKAVRNSYGSIKYIGPFEIDRPLLRELNSIARRGVEPTLENHLTGTPLTIQSIAYDFERQKVVGDIGLEALFSRTVAVNNPEQAVIYAGKKKLTVDELVRKTAESLGFTPQYNYLLT